MVKRYKMRFGPMCEAPDYVLESDYAALQAELASAQERSLALEARCREQEAVAAKCCAESADRLERIWKLEAALEFAQLAIDDLLHLHAAELCDDDAVARTRSRVKERGGSLAYIAEVQQTLRVARGSEKETAGKP